MNARVFRTFSLFIVLPILLAVAGCRQGVETGELQTKSETVELGDAESVSVEIKMGAGELDVSGGAAELLEADFTDNVDELAPEVTYSDGKLIVKHADTRDDIASIFDMDDYRNEWDLRFNEDVPMEMRIDVGAGRTDLIVGSMALTSLDMKTGAGDVAVDLTGAPSLTQFDFEMGAGGLQMDLTGDWTENLNAAITAGVGDLTLQLPGSVGVRVDVTEGAGKVSATNLAKDGDTYTNDAFAESAVTLHLDIKAGVGDINLQGEPAPAAAVPAPAADAAAEEEAQEEEVTVFDEDMAAQLQAILEEAVASPDSNYPGVVMHVSSPELGSWNGAAGLGQVETATPMRPHDRFRAGSVTKPFISVLILQLVEEGLFSLDDPMTAVLPENITGKFANSDQITVRMLLNHTGGLPDFMNLAGPEIVANLEKIWEEEEFLDFAASQEPWFAPGEAQAYSNTDYALLGMVIEEATGRTWREEMRERIFEPLNLENTFLPEPDDVTIPGDHAHGYNDFGAGVMDATEIANASVVGAAGGQSLITNAEDLSQFVTALAAGELFQEAATMEEMLTFVPWPDGNPLSFYLTGYGLGVTQATFGSGIDGVGHTGDTDGGYHAFVYYLPVQGMTISGAVNIKDYEAGFLLIPRALEVLVPGYVAPQQSAEQPDLGAALQGLVDGQVQEQGILGIAMAARAADGTVIGAGSGYSDPAGENAWTVDTQSAIGSVTKSFTAVVIAQLIEEGKLSLDDTIDTWFPDQPNGDKITVRMLLSHTSGLAKYIHGPAHVEAMQAGKFAPEWAPLDLVAEANEAGPVDEPGSSDAHYANTNFVLLGLITEAITGNSWAQEVEARIIQPLDLQNTTFLSAEGILDTMVGGYAKSEDGYQNLLEEPWYPHASSVWSAGEIVATAADLMTFAAALFDGDLVSSETLAVMAQPLGTDPDSGIMWGLGGGTIEGLPPGTFGMGGDVPGASAFYMGVLDTKLVAVALVNSQGGDAIAPSIAALEYLSSVQSSPQEAPAAAFTPPITDAEGNEIPGSIAAIETVNLGGFEQTITLRGVDSTNPVLLFLHGGPGVPSSPWVTWNDFQAELEEHFVVVHWDQRGQGKSFSEDLTPDDMHVENFVSDTLELTDILRQRFEQDKIFLWGHSWGSALGFETLSVNAEPYHAYVASAVRPDWNSTQTMGYEWALEQAQEANDSEAIQALESIQPFDPTNLEHLGMRGEYLSLYRGGDFHTEGLEDAWLDYVLSGQSPEYTAADVEKTLTGLDFTRQTLRNEIIQSGYDLYTDFPVSPIPVYFLAGRHDYETPGELAEAYYDSLEAPAKNFTWFENSAHNMMYDEPDKTNQELIRIANEVLAESDQEGAAQPLVSAELLAELEAYVEESRESLNIPGAAVAIVQGGEIVYAEGFGVRELGSDDPVTADTVFSIGSTGKAMTSMMAASLVDDGIIAWDTPLVDVMPQFQLSDETATQQITLREAFAHTSGLPQLGLVLALSGLSPEDVVEYLANVPLAAPPGELYAYHNEMNSVGAYAAAVAAGAEYGENLLPTYTELMQERVFDPLGMSSATFSAQEAAAGPNRATPHFMGLNATLAETGFDVTPTHYMDIDTIAPAGTVRMSAPDVGRFLITMLSGGVAPDGTRAFSAENLAETWTEQIALEPDPFLEQKGSGLGWSTVTYQGIPLVSKDGNIGGFTAQMAFIPEADTGIVVLANADVLGQMLGRNVQYRLVEMLFGLEPLIDQVTAAELEGIGGASEAYSQLAAVDPETVAPFLGSYDIEGEPYTVKLRDGRLWVSMGEFDFIELLAAPDGSYVAISGGSDLFFAPFQFVEGDDGSITMIIFGQLELPKLE